MSDLALKIGAHKIGVRYKNPDELEDLCDSGRYIHGLWSPYGKQDEIWLNKELKGTMALSVFIHELFEAVNDLFEIGLKHNQITQLGEHFTQILNDNRKTFTNHMDL